MVSPLGVNGMRVLAATSPTTDTLALRLRIRRTATCGKWALPRRRATMSCSIWGRVRPAAGTKPAKGTDMLPDGPIRNSGKLVGALVWMEMPGDIIPPNNTAGGASQMVTFKTSPDPTVSPTAFE